MSYFNFDFKTIFIGLSIEYFILFSTIMLLVFGVISQKIYNKQNNEFYFVKNIYAITKILILVYSLSLILWLTTATNYKDLQDLVTYSLFYDSIISNPFIFFIKILITITTIIVFIICLYFYKNEKIYSFEFPIVISLVSFSLYVLVSSADLILLYLAMELQGLSLYILCAFLQKKNKIIESAIKYFIMGAVASGFYLFGTSLIYWELGTLNLIEIEKLLSVGVFDSEFNILLAFIFILIAFFFKLGVAPLHTWLVDVYEGAPTLAVTYMSVVPKIAVFAVLVRFLDIFYNSTIISLYGNQVLLYLSIFSILIGIFGAYFQEKIRSFVAYSSIANMGYLLLMVSVLSFESNFNFIEFSVSVYLIIYSTILLSIFIIINYLTHWSNNNNIVYLKEISGLGQSKYKQGISIILSLSLFSLMGIPPLAGFFSKFYIIFNLLYFNNYILALLLLLCGVLGTIYYLRVIKLLFFDKRNIIFIEPIPIPILLILILLVLFQVCLWFNSSLLSLIFLFLI